MKEISISLYPATILLAKRPGPAGAYGEREKNSLIIPYKGLVVVAHAVHWNHWHVAAERNEKKIVNCFKARCWFVGLDDAL